VNTCKGNEEETTQSQPVVWAAEMLLYLSGGIEKCNNELPIII